MEDVYIFCEAHPEYDSRHYCETLNSFGIEWNTKDMSSADVSNMDAKGVIALLFGVLRADRFSEGALLHCLENGSILRWLERLQQIDLE